MKLLWTSEEEIDFEGQFYTVKKALQRPKPIQPYPALMNASGSAVGKRFAAKHFDIIFTNLTSREPESIGRQIDDYRTFARAEFGREIKVWVNAYLVMGETPEDAQRRWDHCVLDHGDGIAADNFLTGMGMDSQSIPPDVLATIKNDMIAGYGGFRMLGTKDQIVGDMKMLSQAGIDGMLLTWPAFVTGMAEFQREVYPLLVQEGLR